MELQLGLALPSTTTATSSYSVRGFDLNCYDYEKSELVMGLSPYNQKKMKKKKKKKKKRSFNEAFDEHFRATVPPTLPLLLWNNQPHEEEDDDDDDDEDDDHNNHHPSLAISNKNGDGEVIVGWPPVKSWRTKNRKKKKKNQHNRTVENIDACSSCNNASSYSKSVFVKVKMEGEAIARKIDLSLYHSFPALKHTLINMFGKCHLDSNCYKLTYQDSEGDWLLADDMPWRTFIRSVQRLKLLRTN